MSVRKWERARTKQPADQAFPEEPPVKGPHTNRKRGPVKEYSEAERREWSDVNKGRYGLRASDVARNLGISRTTVYKLVKEDRLHITKIGRCSIFSSEEVEALVRGDAQ